MTLTDEGAERISLFFQVAKKHGSLLTVQEISRLLPDVASEREVAEAISTDPALSSRFELKAGYLTERFSGPGSTGEEEEAKNRRAASANMRDAARFVSKLGPSAFVMVAVSGSTAYGSASHSKDVDFFCVAPSGRMWLSLTLGLITARIFRVASPGSSQVCLSCTMDENFAHFLFASAEDPLFARDALESKVLTGSTVYRALMANADWMSGYYPSAYKSVGAHASTRTPGRPSSFDRVLNRALFLTVGSLIRLKSSLLNRRLRATGRWGDVFMVRCGEDHLVYESNRYSTLRRQYRDALTTRPSPGAVIAR